MSGWERLLLTDGPECDQCGCRDVAILQQPQPGVVWAKTGRARCRHCGKVFPYRDNDTQIPGMTTCLPTTALPPVVIQHAGPLSTRVDVMQPTIDIMIDPTRCPECNAVAKAYSTKGRTQYRKCPQCGNKFKTMREAS